MGVVTLLDRSYYNDVLYSFFYEYCNNFIEFVFCDIMKENYESCY